MIIGALIGLCLALFLTTWSAIGIKKVTGSVGFEAHFPLWAVLVQICLVAAIGGVIGYLTAGG